MERKICWIQLKKGSSEILKSVKRSEKKSVPSKPKSEFNIWLASVDKMNFNSLRI